MIEKLPHLQTNTITINANIGNTKQRKTPIDGYVGKCLSSIWIFHIELVWIFHIELVWIFHIELVWIFHIELVWKKQA
jgi:hypothetical protein